MLDAVLLLKTDLTIVTVYGMSPANAVKLQYAKCFNAGYFRGTINQ